MIYYDFLKKSAKINKKTKPPLKTTYNRVRKVK
jgi:hypothetical protein